MRLIGEAYELRRALGHGPHGTVWHARDHRTGQHVAVKVLDPPFATDPHVVSRFVREETVLEAYVHPGYVRVQRILLDDNYLALITELVPGVDLGRRMRNGARLPPEIAARVASDCAQTLAAGHRVGVVHGDVKPTNVLLVGSDLGVRITDCRVARLARRHGDSAGFADPRYAAPELIRHEPVVPATDVYGVGLLLFTMLTGLAMWDGVAAADARYRQEEYRHLLRQYVHDDWLRDIIDACLSPDRDQRPSAIQLAAALEAPTAVPRPMLAPTGFGALPSDGAAPGNAIPSPSMVDRSPPDAAATGGGRDTRATTSRLSATGHSDGRSAAARSGAGRLIRLTVAVAIAVAAAGLVWPRGHPGTADRSGQSSSPATTATVVAASLAPPQLPPGAATETADGARVVGQYWFDALSYAVDSGNTAALLSVSDPACDACTAIKNTIADTYGVGGSMRGGQYVVRTINLDSFFNLQRATFRVVFDRGPRTTFDATGRQRAMLPAATFAPCQVILGFANGRWQVLAVQSPDPVG